MALAKMVWMDVDEVRAIADPLVRAHFAEYEVGEISVAAETDFDNETIFRVVAQTRRPVSARALIDVSDMVQQALRSRGERRFAILETRRDGAPFDEIEEDVG